MNFPVVILQGKNKGRVGIIHGDLESRRVSVITTAVVYFSDKSAVRYKTSKLREANIFDRLLEEHDNNGHT